MLAKLIFNLLLLSLSTQLYAANCLSLFSLFFESQSINHKLETILKSPRYQTQALSRKHSDLLQQLMALEELIPSKRKTRLNLIEQLQRPPTVAEMLQDAHEQLQRTFIIELDKLGQTAPVLANFAGETRTIIDAPFEHLGSHHPGIYQAIFDLDNGHHLHAFEGYVGQIYGEMGEIIMASKTRNLISHGRHFDNLGKIKDSPLGALITQKIEYTKKTFEFRDVDTLIEKYPRIFHRKDKKGNELEVKTILARAINWLLTKEIDIISNPRAGKMAWIEVKNFSTQVDLNRFLGTSGTKSIYKQLQSYLEIVDLLELTNIVEIKINFGRFGANQEVINYITRMGIEVIP